MKSPTGTSEANSPAPKKERVGPIKFIGQVRAEARKVTWTSRKETIAASIMVAIMVVMAALFFWIVNSALNFAITWLLRVATGG